LKAEKEIGNLENREKEQRFEKKEFKNAPTLALLMEIETRIERADAYIL